ncbi:MAG: acyltransferase [Gammaproteobacteria bacterium]|nr:acyltransferase [Gammaproteobacteria bacterium]MCW8924515.1 acyltransferase [Gammaproteobacteria bacterium]
MNTKRFEVLDSFRGLCAVAVAVAHMRILGLYPVESLAKFDFVKNSWLFVEFFFVLSGFVLAHSYGFKQNFDFRKFFLARSFRLIPLHIFTLLLFVFGDIVKLLLGKYGVSFASPPFTDHNAVSELLPNIFLLQAWSNYTDAYSFNSPSWSISIEYYVCIVFMITLFFKAGFKQLVWLMIAITMFLALYTNFTILTSNSIRGLSCFFFGAFINYLYRCICDKIPINFYLFSIVEILALCCVVYVVSVGSSVFEQLLIVAGLTFGLVILLFSFEGGVVSIFFKLKLFPYLGSLSYSIYLMHWVVISTIIYVFRFPMPVTAGSMLKDNVLLVTVLGMVIICSHFTYKLVELKYISQGKLLIKNLRLEK